MPEEPENPTPKHRRSKRTRQEPVRNFPRPTNRSAIRLINDQVMRERAFDYVYSANISPDEQRALTWLVTGIVAYGDLIPMMKLVEYVRKANDCAQPKASLDIDNAELVGMITSGHVQNKRLFGLPQREATGDTKLSRLENLLDKIREVVAIQLTDPDNPTAGIETFDAEAQEHVYYNIVAQTKRVKDEFNQGI